jgi:hypothetical protein
MFKDRWKTEKYGFSTKDDDRYGNGARIFKEDVEYVVFVYRTLSDREGSMISLPQHHPRTIKDATDLAETFIDQLMEIGE